MIRVVVLCGRSGGGVEQGSDLEELGCDFLVEEELVVLVSVGCGHGVMLLGIGGLRRCLY